jgi:hypothetical protein
MPGNLSAVRTVLARSRDDLLSRSNVVATGIGYKVTRGEQTPTLCIVCSVTEKVRLSRLSSSELIPLTVGDVLTDVVPTGPIRALQSHTDRQRPAPGGVSIGHRNITAGTLGCVVRRDGQIFVLSNNHVLANSNDASPGDAILQPGPHDGGRFPNDQIADLTEFVPISFIGSPSSCATAGAVVAFLNRIAKMLGSRTRLRIVSGQASDNLVDAAIATPINDQDVSDQILEIGPIKGSTPAELGVAIQKSGRTTGFTTGEIQQVDVTVDVDYGAGRTARFIDQVMAGPMSQGGDSGSAILDRNNRLLGLLFAGSDNSTIINRIENVFSALRIGL